MFVTGIVATDS